MEEQMINAAKFFLELIGLITVAISILLFFIAFASWLLGIGPLLYRLGLGRWRRKISVLSDSYVFGSLKADLVSSGIFREKNIDHITKKDLARVKDCNLLLVNYGSFSAQMIKTIIKNKKSSAGMIVYFPDFSPTNRIPEDIVTLINNEPHTVLVNFRGRLINDILVTLLSTSYEKK
jgi:hypothetical protein